MSFNSKTYHTPIIIIVQIWSHLLTRSAFCILLCYNGLNYEYRVKVSTTETSNPGSSAKPSKRYIVKRQQPNTTQQMWTRYIRISFLYISCVDWSLNVVTEVPFEWYPHLASLLYRLVILEGRMMSRGHGDAFSMHLSCNWACHCWTLYKLHCESINERCADKSLCHLKIIICMCIDDMN